MAASSSSPMSSAAGSHNFPAGPSPAHMATTTLKVEGMTCGACTSAVEGAFKGIDGAGAVSVSLMMGRAVVHHDPTRLPAEKVVEIVEDSGFDAEMLSTNTPSTQDDTHDVAGGPRFANTTLAVEGMTCGACTSAVEGAFGDVSGVRSVNVSLLSERAVVKHDTSTISPDTVAEIIEDRGFGAKVLDTTHQSGSNSSQEVTNAAHASGLMVTTVSIEGMTCGACTSSVQNAFEDVEGVAQFNVSLLAERAIIIHDASVLTSQKITTMIEDAGFDAKVISSESHAPASKKRNQISLSLYGLQDGASANTLEEALLQKPGISSAIVNMATSRVSISYDSSVIGVRSVVQAIEAAGCNALLSESDDTNAQLESLSKTKETQDWKNAFLFSTSFAVPVFVINMLLPMYLPGLDFGNLELFAGLYLGDLACLILTIPVQFGIGKRFYISSYKSLKHRSPTMDVLVMLGTSAAFFYSVFTMGVAMFHTPHMRPSTVFDTSTMLITFITLGRWLENRAKGQTSAALSRLMSLAPSMATIYEDSIAAEKQAEEWDAWKTGKEDPKSSAPASETSGPGLRVIPTELIEVGDIVVLRPGDKVSADGVVIRGTSYVDEGMITGEALPIQKKKGSVVIAGTVNGTGSVDFKVTRAGNDTQLSQIVNLVQDAQTSRAPIQRVADVVAGYFVPTIITLGLITFFGWMFLSHLLPHPPKVFSAEGNGGKVMVCLKLCISVIVFACPCALGLSTPTAVMVGTGVGAEHGILVKGGAVLEAATKINHIVFDKTGTLTTGKMSVADANLEPNWTSNEWRRQLWWLIVGLAEMSSEHPIGRAIHAAAKAESGHPGEDGLPGSLGDFDAYVGQGVSALVEPASSAERVRYRVLVGNAGFLRSSGVLVPESVEPGSRVSEESSPSGPKSSALAGTTLIHVAIDNQYTGFISLRDTVKPTAVAAVAALHRMGISTSLVTGDTYSTAVSIANAVGIPTTSVHASVSPADKQSTVGSLQSSGSLVAMVGDGINDSPALATASIGIALASGTDVAMEAADIVLMRPDDLLSVPASLSLSRSVFNRIKLNLLWACLYNFIGLPFAMGIFLPFGGVMLPPMAAGAAMAASSVSVVVSSLLLKFWHRPRWMDVERLEKELELGQITSLSGPGASQKKRWWVSALFVSGASRRRRRLVDGAAAIWRFVTARPGRVTGTDEGYVPLQTVEPVG